MRLMMVRTGQGDVLGVVDGDTVTLLPGHTLREGAAGGAAALSEVAGGRCRCAGERPASPSPA